MQKKMEQSTAISVSDSFGDSVTFFPVKDWPGVKVYTRNAFFNSFDIDFSNQNLRFIVLKKKIVKGSPVCNIFHPDPQLFINEDFEYVISANKVLTYYLVLWLNSPLGRGQLLDYDFLKESGSINKSVIENALVPVVEKSIMRSIVSLMGFAFVAHLISSDMKETDSDFLEMNVASTLLGYYTDYVAMEIVIPEVFKKEGVDVIKSWSELVLANKEHFLQLQPEDIKDMLVQTFSVDNKVRINRNRMRYFYNEFFPYCVSMLSKAHKLYIGK